MKNNSNLKDVPETMLWTLHNRVTEAMRDDGIIKDDKAIEIYNSIDYNYFENFGAGEPSHAVRSLIFDREVTKFLDQYPEGFIVNLGDGLETQQFRIPVNSATWLSVDLPEAIEIRERFIKPDSKHVHFAGSALDKGWMESIPKNAPVFVTAQGLFMYFKESEVMNTIQTISNNLSNGYLMFDTIPEWLSKKTMSEKGWQKTKSYTTPKMPWGINRDKISEIKSWSDNIRELEEIRWSFPRGVQKIMFNIWYNLPILKNYAPSVIKIRIEGKNE
jgi:O-methyltransferase involved in polyketide biosynthesis